MNLDDTVFIRAWVNQLDGQVLAEYASDDGEPVNKRIQRIRGELSSKARYYRKPKSASLWQSANLPVPSWINAALTSLEELCRLPEPQPNLADGVDQWFDDKLLEGLPQPNLSLEALMDYLDAVAVGRQELSSGLAKRLPQLRGFFTVHSARLGRGLAKPANRPSRLVSNVLDEARSPMSLVQQVPPAPSQTGAAIQAGTDWDAASVWLAARGNRSTHTFEAYKREANRLLTWLDEHGLTLAAMTVNHAEQYYAHLAAPPAHWLCPRKCSRQDRLEPTQLLIEKLSPSSIAYARTVLSQMCDYLQQTGYLRYNVFRLTSKPLVLQQSEVTRYLELDSWLWLWRWLCTLPQTRPRECRIAVRARWLFALLYHTGIRREEAANGSMGDFVRRGEGWSLIVVGKRNKEKIVTVNSLLLAELIVYRQGIGLKDLPGPAESTPLIASINPNKASLALTPRAVGRIIKDVSDRAAEACLDDHIRQQVLALSTHWLRHTNATHRLMAGASLETTQDELGHADPRTTRIYAKTTNIKRREDAEKLAGLQNSS